MCTCNLTEPENVAVQVIGEVPNVSTAFAVVVSVTKFPLPPVAANVYWLPAITPLNVEYSPPYTHVVAVTTPPHAPNDAVPNALGAIHCELIFNAKKALNTNVNNMFKYLFIALNF